VRILASPGWGYQLFALIDLGLLPFTLSTVAVRSSKTTFQRMDGVAKLDSVADQAMRVEDVGLASKRRYASVEQLGSGWARRGQVKIKV
jgi:hypothetical protein